MVGVARLLSQSYTVARIFLAILTLVAAVSTGHNMSDYKDGFMADMPVFDGHPNRYVRYRKDAKLWAAGVEDSKQVLVAPRLIRGLKGRCTRLVGKEPRLPRPEWLGAHDCQVGCEVPVPA